MCTSIWLNNLQHLGPGYQFFLFKKLFFLPLDSAARGCCNTPPPPCYTPVTILSNITHSLVLGSLAETMRFEFLIMVIDIQVIRNGKRV
jgi:hypothetical protein